MKLLRILFYQTYRFFSRKKSATKAAVGARTCNFLTRLLVTLSALLIVIGYIVADINHAPISETLCVVAGVVLSLFIQFIMWWKFERHDQYLQIIENDSYDTLANRILFYIFLIGGPALVFGLFSYIIIVVAGPNIVW